MHALCPILTFHPCLYVPLIPKLSLIQLYFIVMLVIVSCVTNTLPYPLRYDIHMDIQIGILEKPQASNYAVYLKCLSNTVRFIYFAIHKVGQLRSY